jgi:hypothetical protein
MTLVCIVPFGHFKPGDKVDVPDDAAFDTAYFKVAEVVKTSAKDTKTEGK